MTFTLLFLAALSLDLLLGDPRNLPHPVQGIGWLCTLFEERTRKILLAKPALAGSIATMLVLVATMLSAGIILMLLHRVFPLLETLVAVLLLSSSIACRSLYDHSMQVYRAFEEGKDITVARGKVAMIVGRDTAALDPQGICRACVETVAENLVDGIIAPIFFAILASCIDGGNLLSPLSLAVLGAYMYKAINTMDSMYGYKNDRYLHFGRIAAHIDDVANYLPARFSGPILVMSAWLLRLDAVNGWRTFKRDRFSHASPNSGHPEAAMAGILGVQLGGDSIYFGSIVNKPTLGDPKRSLNAYDIVLANRLMLAASGLSALVLLLCRLVIVGG